MGSVSKTTSYDTLTVQSDGTYTYVLNDTLLNSLDERETHTETFFLRVLDNHGSWNDVPLTVTITGTNDKPTLTLDNPFFSLTEDATLTADGTFSVANPDADGKFSSTSHSYTFAAGDGTTLGTVSLADDAYTMDTTYGTLVYKTDGTYTYTLKNSSDDVQSLAAGESHWTSSGCPPIVLSSKKSFAARNGHIVQQNSPLAIKTG